MSNVLNKTESAFLSLSMCKQKLITKRLEVCIIQHKRKLFYNVYKVLVLTILSEDVRS